jgi:hypothetical protein
MTATVPCCVGIKPIGYFVTFFVYVLCVTFLVSIALIAGIVVFVSIFLPVLCGAPQGFLYPIHVVHHF